MDEGIVILTREAVSPVRDIVRAPSKKSSTRQFYWSIIRIFNNSNSFSGSLLSYSCSSRLWIYIYKQTTNKIYVHIPKNTRYSLGRFVRKTLLSIMIKTSNNIFFIFIFPWSDSNWWTIYCNVPKEPKNATNLCLVVSTKTLKCKNYWQVST